MAFMQFTLPDHWLYPFVQLVNERTGIRIRDQDYGELARKIGMRMAALHLVNPDQYYQHLATVGASGETEWDALITLLTNVESYFFRDQGQFQLLEQVLLPRLIVQKRAERRLRIWSAGCSTGEEPYSVAILVQQLLAHEAGWHCEVIGTDINPTVLARARQGYYPMWSLRSLAPMIQTRYFQPYGNGFQLDAKIRQAVRFESFNLAKPSTEQWCPSDVDLIVCRNVFIYFSAPAISTALESFRQALNPAGYLMTGHAELYGQQLQAFQSHLFPESVVYQRRDRPTPLVAIPPSLPVRSQPLPPPPRPPAPSLSPPSAIAAPPSTPLPTVQDLLTEAEFFFQQKNYRLSRKKVEAILSRDPQSFAAYFLRAQLDANSGQYDAAIQSCEKALELEPLSVSIYYLMAQIFEERGDTEKAKQLFKKIIYLEPTAILAYYELSQLYDQEGNSNRGQKMRQTALAFLQQLPPQSRVDERSDLTVADLIDRILPSS
jgi:chemotaxis protein methyltransferase CheR